LAKVLTDLTPATVSGAAKQEEEGFLEETGLDPAGYEWKVLAQSYRSIRFHS
jgi:hypothetical protein